MSSCSPSSYSLINVKWKISAFLFSSLLCSNTSSSWYSIIACTSFCYGLLGIHEISIMLRINGASKLADYETEVKLRFRDSVNLDNLFLLVPLCNYISILSSFVFLKFKNLFIETEYVFAFAPNFIFIFALIIICISYVLFYSTHLKVN